MAWKIDSPGRLVRTSTAQFIPIAVSLGIVILLGIDFFIINICFSLILSVTINYASIHIRPRIKLSIDDRKTLNTWRTHITDILLCTLFAIIRMESLESSSLSTFLLI